MIGNLRPQLAHAQTEAIETAILTTRETFHDIATRCGAHPHTVTRIASRLRAQGQRVPRRGKRCKTCGLVVVRLRGARSCYDCRHNGERIKIAPRGCKAEGCDRDSYTRGLCRRCYQRVTILGTAERRAAHSRRVIANRKRREAMR